MSSNYLKKELKALNPYQIAAAIECCTHVYYKDMEDIRIDLDLINLATYTKIFVRKRALVGLKRIMLTKPQNSDQIVTAIVGRLTDDSDIVVNSAVSTILELPDKSLFKLTIPTLYGLLENSKNWIKINTIHLLCEFLKVEPRLEAKLANKLHEMLGKGKAISVEYEIGRSILKYFCNYPLLIDAVEQKISTYLQSNDRNINYIALRLIGLLLKQKKEILIVYKDQLLRMYLQGDEATNIQIINILCSSVTEVLLPDIAAELLKAVPNSTSFMKAKLIQSYLAMVSDLKLIKDPSWLIENIIFLLQYIPPSLEKQLADFILEVIKAIPSCKEKIAANIIKIIPIPEQFNLHDESRGLNGELFSTILFVLSEYGQPNLEAIIKYISSIDFVKQGYKAALSAQFLLAKWGSTNKSAILPIMAQKLAFDTATQENLSIIKAMLESGEITKWEELSQPSTDTISELCKSPELTEEIKIDAAEIKILDECPMIKILMEVEESREQFKDKKGVIKK
jgi:hypothetical protein